MPADRSRSAAWTTRGTPRTGSDGLARSCVSGCMRVPVPAARIIPLMAPRPSWLRASRHRSSHGSAPLMARTPSLGFEDHVAGLSSRAGESLLLKGAVGQIDVVGRAVAEFAGEPVDSLARPLQLEEQ